jgi:hypothetical protein
MVVATLDHGVYVKIYTSCRNSGREGGIVSVIISNFDKVRPYLDGLEFSANMDVLYDNVGRVAHRNDVLVEVCRSKRILHVGCCDHVPLIRSKIKAGEWLHGQLTAVASRAIGIDIDKEAVVAANEISGLNNIIAGDLTSPVKIDDISSEQFDYAVFGEVLEHIGNPVDFLRAFQTNYRRNVKKIVITVPNAFRAGNVKGIFANREVINSDHRFFFTPYTIAKIATDAGISPDSIQMATFSKKNWLQNTILNKWPLLAEDIILFGTNEAS